MKVNRFQRQSKEKVSVDRKENVQQFDLATKDFLLKRIRSTIRIDFSPKIPKKKSSMFFISIGRTTNFEQMIEKHFRTFRCR